MKNIDKNNHCLNPHFGQNLKTKCNNYKIQKYKNKWNHNNNGIGVKT